MDSQRRSNILDPIAGELPPLVWENPASPEPTLKPVHAHWITSHIYKILDQSGYDKPQRWLRLYMTGSLCGYQYSDASDADMSLFVDATYFPEWSRAEMIGIMIKGTEGLTLPGTPYELQAYVVAKQLTPSDLYQPGLRAGYDIDNHRWISPPDRVLAHDVQSQDNGAYVYALEVADKMHKLLQYEPQKAVMFWHQIHKKRMRDENMGKGDTAESNLAYKMLFKKGLIPEIAEVSGEHIAAWTAPGDVSLTTQPSQNVMQPGPSPYANVGEWQINMGEPSLNYSPRDEAIRNMMMSTFPNVPYDIHRGISSWEGKGENSIQLRLYTTHPKAQEVLKEIGQLYSEEEAFALKPTGFEPDLWSNTPANRAVREAPGEVTSRPEVSQEGSVIAQANLPFLPRPDVASAPRSQQDPLVAFGSGVQSFVDIHDDDHTSKTAGLTRNQYLRQMAELEQKMGPDKSRLNYQFDNGWSVVQPKSQRDVKRVGTLMRHCWQSGFTGAGDPHVLRDPDGIPRIAWNSTAPHMAGAGYTPPDIPQGTKVFAGQPHAPAGHGDSPPKPEHWDMLREWAAAQNPPTLMWHYAGEPNAQYGGYVLGEPGPNPYFDYEANEFKAA